MGLKPRLPLPRIASSMTSEEGERLAELAAGKVVLELGAYYGFSTVTMAQRATMVHSVDWHRGDPHAGDELTLAGFMANLDEYGVRERVVAYVGRSEVVLPMFRPESFDFAFHDAYHTTEAVAADAALILPLLKPGSLLAFHDYGLFGVKDAVDALGLDQVGLFETLVVVRV